MPKNSIFEIKTKKRGFVNPMDEPLNWQGLCGQVHFENNHLIVWCKDTLLWQRLHKMPASDFRINGLVPFSVEIR